MKRLLHLLVNPPTRNALQVMALQAERSDMHITVVVGPKVPATALPQGVKAYRLGENDGLPTIDHARLLELIFAADTIVTW